MMQKRAGLHTLIRLMLFLWSGLAGATALDGGEVRFVGHVTNEGPRWVWQIPSSQQHWTVDVSDARISGEQLFFRPGNGVPLPFLEGRLYRVAERGGPGYTPLVQFSSQGQPFLLPKGGSLTDGRFRAAVPVINPQNGDVAGQLNFTLVQGVGVSFGLQDEQGTAMPSGMSLLRGGTVSSTRECVRSSSLITRLSALLQMIPDFSLGMSAVSNGQVIAGNVLMSGRVRNIAAAYASELSDFELVLSGKTIPEQWQARLGVTVTVQ
ncbi:TPA: fimbrial protein [Citrobacter werkmanii]|nr:fimbrial protein [Citrobacter werkmanii]